MEENIREILNNTKLFNQLSDSEIDHLSQNVSQEQYKTGEVILVEGEIGDKLYIIVEGAVRVYIKDDQKGEIVLARLEKGDYFGEQALLTAKPIRRDANVRALTEVKAITIPHFEFQKCLTRNSKLHKLLQEIGQDQLRAKFINQMYDDESNLIELSSLFTRIEHIEERQVLFRQDRKPDYAYYLLTGMVEIRFYDEQKFIKSRSLLTPGNFFGELSIIENKLRAGTAIAVSGSQVAFIEKEKFLEVYKRNPKLHDLILSTFSLYHLPLFGSVTQYQGNFLGKPTINSTIKKLNGDVLIASRLVNEEMYIIYNSGYRNATKEYFQDNEDRSREILIEGNRLVGATSIGLWDDLDEITRYVDQKIFVTKNDLDIFHSVGRLKVGNRSVSTKEGNICVCMQVKYASIQDLILKGVTTFESISKKTAAGTVCGGCKPRIKELIGGAIWNYVTIAEIREHNSYSRSYRFRPLQGKLNEPKVGQSIVVEANIEGLRIARSYTLTSIDSEKDYYEITVKREPLGLFSNWLFEKGHVGTNLRVSEPQGNPAFQVEKECTVLCFSAGIGITPAIAFIKKIYASQKKRRIHVDYSVRNPEDLVFQNELLMWPNQCSDITINVRLTGQKGHINKDDVCGLLSRYPDADIFICGPKAYEKSISSILKEKQIDPEKIYLETFTHTGGPLGEENDKNSKS